MVGRRAAALSGGVVLLCSCGSGGGKTTPQTHFAVIGRDTVSGKHATASASADPGLDTRFSARVSAKPDQRVTGGWVIPCNSQGPVSRDAADFSGRTPLVVRMHTEQARASQLLGGGGTCEVIATASLTRSGRVTVAVLGGR